MNIETPQPAPGYTLKLEGRCTIERVNAIRHMLVEALGDHDRIVVDLEDITEVDLSCLQLLCSAHRASLDRNKQLVLHENLPDAFKKVVQIAGYVRTLGCHKDPAKSCLWRGVSDQ
jgi:ABC-type transporter Mla MlaB component